MGIEVVLQVIANAISGFFLVCTLALIWVVTVPVDFVSNAITSREASSLPHMTLATYPCAGSTYAWQVTEQGAAAVENPKGLSGAEEQTSANLVDTTSGKIVTTLEAELGNTIDFPIGGPFVSAYVIHAPLSGQTDANALSAIIPGSEMDEQSFGLVAECLAAHASPIETEVNSNPENGGYVYKVGWLALGDSSLAQSGAPATTQFICQNQDILAVTEQIVDQGASHNAETILGEIGSDGKIRMYANETIPNGCKDSEGVSLDDFLASIPQRVTVLAASSTSTSAAVPAPAASAIGLQPLQQLLRARFQN